jgi:hypothetical protein
MTINKAIPIKSSAVYKAASLIQQRGPMSLEVLQAEIDFGPKKTRQGKLVQAFSIGWLCETPAGTIDVTEKTRQHFADQEPGSKPIGQITPAQYRPNVFASQGISKKNRPNRHGLRHASDLPPVWSRREDLSIKTIAGGEA